MPDSTVLDLVVVGGGPRAVSLLERLTARLQHDGDGIVTAAVIDAVEVGPGATWRTDQTAQFLNNTTASATTIYPDESTPIDSPEPTLRRGPTLVEWARELVERGTHETPWAVEEARGITPGSFTSRRLQGVYYADQLARIEAERRVRVERLTATAVDLSPADEAGEVGETGEVVLADGRRLRGRTIVLAQGMVQARPDASVRGFTEAAERLGLRYIGPGMPAEQPWRAVPGGEDVIVQGLGANFFDVVAELTAARGGRFEPVHGDPHGRLRYLPSGSEPRLHAGSRRGVPYRSKGDLGDGPAPRFEARFATSDRFAALRGAPSASLAFGRDVWPAIAADLAYAYAGALAARDETAVPGGVEALERDLAEAVDRFATRHPDPRGAADAATEAIDAVLAEHLDRPDADPEAFRVAHLQRPTRGEAVGADAWDRAVTALVEAELDSMANPVTSPRQAVNRAMGALRGPAAQLASRGLIEGASAVAEVHGWFNADGLFLASGPPASRTREVLALIEAGVVALIGPETRVRVDAESRAFVAESPISGNAVAARTLIETRMSKGKVPDTDDPLLRSLLDSGRARIHSLPAADGSLAETDSVEALPARAERDPLALVDADGAVHSGVLVLGIPAISTQPGSAIGATPGVPSPLLAGADIAARTVLRRREAARERGEPVAATIEG